MLVIFKSKGHSAKTCLMMIKSFVRKFMLFIALELEMVTVGASKQWLAKKDCFGGVSLYSNVLPQSTHDITFTCKYSKLGSIGSNYFQWKGECLSSCLALSLIGTKKKKKWLFFLEKLSWIYAKCKQKYNLKCFPYSFKIKFIVITIYEMARVFKWLLSIIFK